MQVGGIRHEQRRAVDSPTVECAEELSGSVVDEDPDQRDSHRHHRDIGAQG